MAKRKKSADDIRAERGFDCILLETAIERALPLRIRDMPTGYGWLCWAELFASKRAETLQPQVIALWDALCFLENQTVYRPSELYGKELTQDQYEKHMAQRIAVANQGY